MGGELGWTFDLFEVSQSISREMFKTPAFCFFILVIFDCKRFDSYRRATWRKTRRAAGTGKGLFGAG